MHLIFKSNELENVIGIIDLNLSLIKFLLVMNLVGIYINNIPGKCHLKAHCTRQAVETGRFPPRIESAVQTPVTPLCSAGSPAGVVKLQVRILYPSLYFSFSSTTSWVSRLILLEKPSK